MLPTAKLYSKAREVSDMADLEVLGGITFDLGINKEEGIRSSFIALVGMLGTREFLVGYSKLYQEILLAHRQKKLDETFDPSGLPIDSPAGQKEAPAPPSAETSSARQREEARLLPAEDVPDLAGSSCDIDDAHLFQEISISAVQK